MGSESVADIAESIRATAALIQTKAEVIINARWEADMVEAFDQIEAAVKRARAIM